MNDANSARKTPVFDDILAPVGRQQFLARYWEREPMLIGRTDARLLKEFEVPVLQGLVETAASAGHLDVMMSDPGGTVGVRKPTSALEAVERFEGGATLRVISAERWHSSLSRLCSVFAEPFGCVVTANVYYTPPLSCGLERHVDTHDVFALQLLGAKTWILDSVGDVLPLQFPPLLQFERAAALRRAADPDGGSTPDQGSGVGRREYRIQRAGLLYVPRGWPHTTRTDSEPSVHVTFGVHVATWLDLLVAGLRRTAQTNVSLRRALLPAHQETLAEWGRLIADLPRVLELGAAMDELQSCRQIRPEPIPPTWLEQRAGRAGGA